MDTRRRRAQEAYDAVPEHIRDDLVEAAIWARRTLTEHEGAGHDIQLSGDAKGLVCSFAKPSWSGDHSGSPRDTASEAIVIAVCEYLAGL